MDRVCCCYRMLDFVFKINKLARTDQMPIEIENKRVVRLEI